MKINKTLNSFANESLEKYNNQNFLAELLQKIQPPIVEKNSLKLNKLVISTFSVALVLALSIPIIVNSSQAKNPTVPINSTVPTTSNPTSENNSFVVNSPIPRFTCEIISNQMEFEVNNAKLTFAYGGNYDRGIEYELENLHDIPSFDLIFENDDGKKVLYKQVNENLVSEKYNTRWILREDLRLDHIAYNHSEDIIIPSELFEKDSGKIKFFLCGKDLKSANNPQQASQYSKILYITFRYKLESGKVVFSNIDKGW